MKISAKFCDANRLKTDGLVVGVFESAAPSGLIAEIDKSLGGHIKKAFRDKVFTGKSSQILNVDSLGKHPAGKIILAGLGKKKEAKLETIRKAAGKAALAMKSAGIKKYSSTLSLAIVKKENALSTAQAVAEGTALALYSFDLLKSEKDKKIVEQVTLVAGSDKEEADIGKGARKGLILAESACLTRDLVNSPGNRVTPTFLANEAKKVGRKHNIKIKVLDPKAIEKLKMGALMGVAKGSHQPARFIIMEWMKGPKGKKPIVLVGKGLTFDTGGISIKPAGNMEEMKSDMSGGGAVIGAMKAAAALKLKVNLVGLVPATENMPGGSAIKPGDVVKGLSGVTMEVINTDAEGRLILSDALAYAKRYKPDCVVDMATLTGACMVALGSFATGLFGNDEKLMEQLREAGEDTGERCWPMPLWPEYEEQIKSDVADVKNVGPRWGGAITAAAFLKKSVDGQWAHLDIAGTAYNNSARGYITKGASGIGVRHMIRFIEKRAGLK